MNHKDNTNLRKRKGIIITLVALTVVLIVLAIKVYSANYMFGVNETSNEDTLTRLVAGLAKAQYADRLVTLDNVSLKLFGLIDINTAKLVDNSTDDVIEVTYTSGRTYYIRKNTAYTIIYNANGGTNPPAAQKQGYGQRITLTTAVPTREGYNFLGWSTNFNSEKAEYLSGASYAGSGNITLYAVWKLKTYTITYDANNGTGAPAEQEKIHGQELTLSLKEPTRTGHTFNGWNTSASATTAAYSAGGTYTTDADATLYAVWQANTYKITYNANGGSGAPGVQTYTYANSGTITLSSTKPTCTGYQFLGWSESSTATTATYSAGGTWNLSKASDTILYAVWKQDKYTVSYNANGGSGSTASQTANIGTSITLNASTFTPPSGKEFANWNTNISGTGTSYNAGATFTSTSNVTLYAIWRERRCTVTRSEERSTDYYSAACPNCDQYTRVESWTSFENHSHCGRGKTYVGGGQYCYSCEQIISKTGSDGSSYTHEY